ncbi:hypothetical protein C7M22_02640 [Bacillus velezensis]|uniref:hypothetical protein n=1 Tax=Bacillus velezensis TaxID=492670 RepID=UPI000F62F281|nr:hypothetical protein [Bacillus velezensis]QHK08415.1 hypothetical protein C7M19_03459 [Bacillus velezensis]QHK10061.1 hypothetical protein C7M20_01185 [Bacillus velezensis]QHK16091.1 hypothetical protein C7M21_03360 [Bacillus velezensis]QHK64683.1 hypothetical protein C7M22_02640 [Bacillus velezensis]QHL93351.1 hypothetical protein C7M24_01337 [Bacillus velezensis]
MTNVLVYVKPDEVLTVDVETGEILRKISGCHRDLLVSQALFYCQNAGEVPTIVYQREEDVCTAYLK